MVYILPLLVALVGSSSLVSAQYGYGGDGYGYGSSPSSSTKSVAAAQPTTKSSNAQAAPANSASGATANGDFQCSSFMCISATVNGSNLEYVMQSTGSQKAGWMGMGFGSDMLGSPMVVMWFNADGTVSLSQRQASSHSLPAVVPNPPRVATAVTAQSTATGANPKFVYTIPMDSNMQPHLIWAFGADTPSSSVPSQATFKQHVGFGLMQLDLTKTTSVNVLESPAAPVNSDGQPQPTVVKKSSAEMVALAHGIIFAIAYLVIMPSGALLARYYRTFSSSWFKGHWILQFAITAPFVVAGTVLAISISHVGGPSAWGTHAQVGVLLICLYATQCLLGAVIHFVKPKNAKGRPPQNYAHAVLGLTIISLAFFQVHTGYKYEWVNVSGRQAPAAINVLWYIWVVVIPLAYFGGLAFLKKQYRQEAESRAAKAQQKPLVSWPTKDFSYSGSYGVERKPTYGQREERSYTQREVRGIGQPEDRSYAQREIRGYTQREERRGYGQQLRDERKAYQV